MHIELPTDSSMRSSNFLFGVATSSFQIEGEADSRLPSIWDTFCDSPGRILDGSNGRIACDHVNRFQDDVALMADLGVDAYRFSISWPRVILQDGSLNQEGLDYYRRLLECLNQNEIKPFATLYHWDLPQYLEDDGGWLNRDTSWRFRDYADLVSRALGDDVFSWATLNEPFCSSRMSYEMGLHAPGFSDRGMAKQAAHHLLLAHGLAMQVLQGNCPDAQNGIVLNLSPSHPASDSEADIEAASRADDDFNHWFAQPVLAGAYPGLIDVLPREEVPDIREGDMETIFQPLDFLGVNYYMRGVFRSAGNALYEAVPQTGVPLTDMGWEIYPDGLTEVLDSLYKKYRLPPVYITENGAAMIDRVVDGAVDDPERTRFFEAHLGALDKAMKAGADVRGYFAWSLMDNFEWNYGYSKRFGLVYVDYETQERKLKASGRAFRHMLRTRTERIAS
jgi:beta-glucosidase